MKKRKKAKNISSQTGPGPKIRSSFKYVYLAAFFVLLSGFFHPLITQTGFEGVIVGTLVLSVGLAGAVLLYMSATSESRRTICLGGGFALVAISLSCIFYLTGRF